MGHRGPFLGVLNGADVLPCMADAGRVQAISHTEFALLQAGEIKPGPHSVQQQFIL